MTLRFYTFSYNPHQDHWNHWPSVLFLLFNLEPLSLFPLTPPNWLIQTTHVFKFWTVTIHSISSQYFPHFVNVILSIYTSTSSIWDISLLTSSLTLVFASPMGIWYVISMCMFLIIEEDKSLFHMFVFLFPLLDRWLCPLFCWIVCLFLIDLIRGYLATVAKTNEMVTSHILSTDFY